MFPSEIQSDLSCLGEHAGNRLDIILISYCWQSRSAACSYLRRKRHFLTLTYVATSYFDIYFEVHSTDAVVTYSGHILANVHIIWVHSVPHTRLSQDWMHQLPDEHNIRIVCPHCREHTNILDICYIWKNQHAFVLQINWRPLPG